MPAWWVGLVFISDRQSSIGRVNKFVKVESGDTIGSVVSVNVPHDFTEFVIDEITASAKFEETCAEKFIRCVADMPVDVLTEANMKYIQCKMKTPPTMTVNSTEEKGVKSAFDVLMTMRRNYAFLPKPREKKTEKDRLYNDMITCLEKENVKFMNHQMELGTRVVQDLCDVLWYLDPFHERLRARHIKLPKPFDEFSGYRNWKQQHKREPKITLEELNLQMEKLSRILMLPWIMNDKFASFRSKLSCFLEGLQKYAAFLSKQIERSISYHKRQEPVRSWNDRFIFQIKSSADKAKKNRTESSYSNVIKALENFDFYEPLDLVELEPSDAVKRRSWLEYLELPFPYGIFKYSHGNYLGNLTVIWKQPVDENDRDSTEDIRVINDIKSNMTKYATRAMRKEFLDTCIC